MGRNAPCVWSSPNLRIWALTSSIRPWSTAKQADEGQGHGLEVDLNAWPWWSDPDGVLSPEA